MAEPKRPAGVPGDARWVVKDEEWEQGGLDDDGEKSGPYRWWRADGTLCAESTMLRGVESGSYRRYHESGEVSQEGTVVDGKRHGVCAWQQSSEPSTELTMPPGVDEKVWRIECDFDMGVVSAKRLFDDQDRRVDASGEPLEERPEGVPPGAQFMPRKRRWYLGQHEGETPRGVWRQWTGDGELFVEVCYEDGVGHPVGLDGVPPEVVWNEAEEDWELGQMEEDRRVGPWRWWRPGGELLCRSEFNRRGQLHGPFVRFHPGGTPSREGHFRNGKEHGVTTYSAVPGESPEPFPAEPPVARMERHHHEGVEQQRSYFLADGAECTSRGVPLSDAFDDEPFTHAQPERFLEEGGFSAFLEQAGLLTLDIASVPGINRFEEVWGRPMPGDLRLFLSLLARTGWADLYELRADPVGFPCPGADDNLLEHIITSDQQNYLGTELSDLFAGTMFIGSLGNGDTYHFGLFDDLHLERGQVYLHDHETAEMVDPVAVDLSSFCFLVSLCHAHDELESVSPEGFAEAYRLLENRVAVPWHFRDLQTEHAGVKGEEFDYNASHQQSRLWFYRSAWIRYLLRNDGVVDVESMPEVFNEQFNPSLDSDLHEQFLENAPRYVPTALYLLFRYFFFDDEARLTETLAACEGSPSRLICDAVELVRQLQQGRQQLGSIDDIQALRRRFLELDLDPDRAEAREVERQQAAAEADRARQEAARRVETMVARGEDLAELAWSDLDDADQHRLILEAWREQPEMARTVKALDWIDGNGHEQAGLSREHELDEVGLFLALHGDRRVVPLLVGRMLAGGDGTFRAGRLLARMAHGGLEPRANHALRNLLEVEEKYEHRRTAAVRILAEAGDRKCTARLRQILTTRRLDGDYGERIQREDLVAATLEALGALGDERCLEALVSCINEESAGYDKVRPLAARALGLLGMADGLPAIVEHAAQRPAPELLWAAGELHGGAPEELQQLALRELRRHQTVDDLTLRVVAQGAYLRAGGSAPDLVDTVAEALRQPAYGRDETRERKIWALRTLGEHAQVPLELAAPFVHTDEHPVREAARAAVARRGAEAPGPSYTFSFLLDDALAEGGLDRLHEALLDPATVFRYRVALRLAEHGDPASVGPLARAVEVRIQDFTAEDQRGDTPQDLAVMVRALASFNRAEGNRVLVRCLEHPSRQVRDPVLRCPPQDPALVPAMVHLLDDDYQWIRGAAEQFLEPFTDTDLYREAMARRERGE